MWPWADDHSLRSVGQQQGGFWDRWNSLFSPSTSLVSHTPTYPLKTRCHLLWPCRAPHSFVRTRWETISDSQQMHTDNTHTHTETTNTLELSSATKQCHIDNTHPYCTFQRPPEAPALTRERNAGAEIQRTNNSLPKWWICSCVFHRGGGWIVPLGPSFGGTR